MTRTGNSVGRRIGGAAAVAAGSLLIVALVLAYYLWSYGPVDHLERAMAGEEALNPSYVQQQWLREFANAIDGQRGVFTDFVWHYRPAGILIYATGLPGHKFYYSAFFALSIAPLGWIPLAEAGAVWAWIQVAAIALLVLVPGLKFLQQSRRTYYMYLVLTLLSLPVLHNLMWGQVSVPLVVCMLGTLILYLRGARFGAAALLALATSIKFYPAILAIYFLIRREIKLLMVFAAWTLLLAAAVPAARLGIDGFMRFHKASNQALEQVRDDTRIDSNSQYLPHVAMRYLNAEDPRQGDPRAFHVLAYGLFAANVLLLCSVVRARLESEPQIAFCLLLLSTPLIVQTSWPHYFVYLPFCQVFAWQMLGRRQLDAGVVLLYGMVAASAVLSSSVFFNWYGDFRNYNWYGSLFWSNMLLLAVLYAQLVPPVMATLGRRHSEHGTQTHTPSRPARTA